MSGKDRITDPMRPKIVNSVQEANRVQAENEKRLNETPTPPPNTQKK